jgi:N-glycosylase/DNA lyase
LQVHINLNDIIKTFPKDEYLNTAIKECCGLRIVKQEPWECLASFLMSSSKQIVQIKQIISNLCCRFGKKIETYPYLDQQYAFPEMETIAMADESALRECKMGFRAAYLKNSAVYILKNRINLADLSNLPVEEARNILMELPGVGAKIANCVLLFSLGFYQAFPVDVWVKKALQRFYFDNIPQKNRHLEEFASNYFGEYGGYAQQYLFHYIRTKLDTDELKK